jgi:hypothetical protein
MSRKCFCICAALGVMCLTAFSPGCAVPEKERVQAPERISPAEERAALEEEMEAEKGEEIKFEVSRICDVLAEHVFRQQFDEAKKILEKSQDAIQQLVTEKAAHKNAAVGEGYRLWQDMLANAQQILSSTELGEEEKKTKAMRALDAAAQAKRAAAFAETFE